MLCVVAAPPIPRWYSMRPAQSTKPATYRCPLCDRRLPALSQHMLLFPEGQAQGRRHAHTACVLAARRDGRLLTRGEFARTQPRPPSLLTRIRTRLAR